MPFFTCNMEGADAFMQLFATPDERAHPLTALLMMYLLLAEPKKTCNLCRSRLGLEERKSREQV